VGEDYTNLINRAINEFNYIIDFNLTKKRIDQVFSHIPQIHNNISYNFFVSSFGSNVPIIDREKAYSFINHITSADKTKDYSTQVVELRFENYENKTKFDWSSIKCIYEEKNNELHAYVISRDITVEKENEINVIRSSQRDPLTGLVNRFGFLLLANQALLNSTYKNTKLAVFFLDIDNFKDVNDTYGHIIGDNTLIEVSNVLKTLFTNDDIVCRYGGDEFIIVLNDFSDINQINTISQLLCNSISQIKFPTDEIKISCSIGISLFPNHSDDLEKLIIFSDIALYQAKNLGKNRFVLFEKENKEMILSNTIAKKRSQLLNQDKLFNLIFEELEKGVMITDADTYKILYVNNRFKEILNIPKSKPMVSRPCFEALYNHNGPCFHCDIKEPKVDYKVISIKGINYIRKTRMIEWDNQIAYITFLGLYKNNNI